MTYTADFRQPRKQLNPLDVPMAATITVELFSVGRNPKRWKARIVGGRTIPVAEGKTDMQYPEPSGGIRAIKDQLKTLFDEQLSPWVEHLSIDEQYELEQKEKKTAPKESRA